MRKLKNRYFAGGILGALAGFLFAFLDDMEFAAAEAHRGKTHKPDPATWAVWTVIGGTVGVPLAFVPRVLRGAVRHPVLSLIALLFAGNKWLWDGIDGVEHRISTTSLGGSPSLQSCATTSFPLPPAADDVMGIGESR